MKGNDEFSLFFAAFAIRDYDARFPSLGSVGDDIGDYVYILLVSLLLFFVQNHLKISYTAVWAGSYFTFDIGRCEFFAKAFTMRLVLERMALFSRKSTTKVLSTEADGKNERNVKNVYLFF